MEFELTMRCVVTKVVTVQCDNEEQALNDPWEYAVHEQEVEQIDYEITHVECIEKE